MAKSGIWPRLGSSRMDDMSLPEARSHLSRFARVYKDSNMEMAFKGAEIGMDSIPDKLVMDYTDYDGGKTIYCSQFKAPIRKFLIPK